MSRKLVLSMVCMLGIVSVLGVTGVFELAQASPYKDIDVDTAHNMITNGSYPDLVLFDVRTKSECDGGHIYKAVWIPVTELETRIDELAGHEEHEIIVYCLSGGRSEAASGILESYNFTKVYNMLGGISAWESASYPTWMATVHNLNTTINYDTIQAAIDANQTLDGHTIFVEGGIYHESVVINKSVDLVGQNRSITIIDSNETGTVVANTQDKVSITGFTIQNSGGNYHSGIYLNNATHCNIAKNNIINNNVGIWLKESSNNTISGNHMENNRGVIRLEYSSNNIISGNNITTNNSSGILLYESSNNTISGNNIENNNVGIWLKESSNNTISGNNIKTNNYEGILLHSFSSNNTVSGNNIENNKEGIKLYGSSNNNIHQNNFINNSFPVVSGNSINSWNDDYPSGGNYWSDYNRIDIYSGVFQNETGSDGVGDKPHKIDENNQDNHPLMGIFSDFNATLGHHVQTICNSTIADFKFNGTAISFNVTGENETSGFFRICIPKALMNDTFRVFVNDTEILPSPEPLPCSNKTHNYLYFTYSHSTQEVIIIPEFPSFLFLPLFMIATLLIVIAYRRNYCST